MSFMGTLYWCWLLVFFASAEKIDDPTINKLNETFPKGSIVAVDEGIHHGSIMAFATEWNKTFYRTTGGVPALSPIYFWFRCLDNELKGYFFMESASIMDHSKETFFPYVAWFQKNVKVMVNAKEVKYKLAAGGGMFTAKINNERPDEDDIHISINTWRHYTIFPRAQCKKARPPSKEMNLVMNIHTRSYDRVANMNKKIVDGVAYHYTYHRCLLGIDRYELVVQASHIPVYMENKHIAAAVKRGVFVFITKNEVVPAPIYMPGTTSNCYYQAITQNLAILQHWKESARLFLWDTDEYMVFPIKQTRRDFLEPLLEHPIRGYYRNMGFCNNCRATKKHDVDSFSLSQRTYKNGGQLPNPKLVIDPNVAGCFMIHWAGCGSWTKFVDNSTAFISHFERMYHIRDRVSDSSIPNMPVLHGDGFTKCDPKRVFERKEESFYFADGEQVPEGNIGAI